MAQVLRTFDPARRSVLMTDARNVVVAAILTQPDEQGRRVREPQASSYGSGTKLPGTRPRPAGGGSCVMGISPLSTGRRGRHYLLGGGAARPEGCWTDFDLRTDNQAIT